MYRSVSFPLQETQVFMSPMKAQDPRMLRGKGVSVASLVFTLSFGCFATF